MQTQTAPHEAKFNTNATLALAITCSRALRDALVSAQESAQYQAVVVDTEIANVSSNLRSATNDRFQLEVFFLHLGDGT